MAVEVKECSICGDPIPQGKTRSELMELGYSGAQLGSPRSPGYANLVFCPKHNSVNICKRILEAVERRERNVDKEIRAEDKQSGDNYGRR